MRLIFFVMFHLIMKISEIKLRRFEAILTCFIYVKYSNGHLVPVPEELLVPFRGEN